VYVLDFSSAPLWEDFTPALLELLQAAKPAFCLISATKRLKLIAGRLAARLRTSVLTDVMALSAAAEAQRLVYGGAAVRTERSLTETVIALVGPAIFAPRPPEPEKQGAVELLSPAPSGLLIRQETRPKQGEAVNLAAAKTVLAVGRGLARQEDLGLVHDLAAALGAEVGCSRPIAEGEGWLARERYIGVSGVMLQADVYIGAGISGQVQHMVGVRQARTVAAVNKDKNAPIFKQADYGLVGDLYTVLPQLTEKFKR
jgi:electron transfer flavoprotein alpha subunit